MSRFTHNSDLDVLIVGAGPSGLGVANVLRELGVSRYCVVDRGEVGESFSRWPLEMRFITPSFPAHGFGLLDLNALVPRSSPGLTLKTEHLSGRQYAVYLRSLVEHFELNVQTRVEVIEVVREHGRFIVRTNTGAITARYVVWAAGEFQYPRISDFEGAELCQHNSTVVSWEELHAKNPIIIGGNESGIDSAVHLSRRCESVRVIDPTAAWDSTDHDPSQALSPFTQDRLRALRKHFRIELLQDEIVSVERNGKQYVCTGDSGRRHTSDAAPVLATGFMSSLAMVCGLFDFDDQQRVLLNESDESLATPGLFLAGPMIRHPGQVFCFIYKFRQRFAIVGCEIGRRLGLATDEVEQAFRAAGMFLDDLSCCVNECEC